MLLGNLKGKKNQHDTVTGLEMIVREKGTNDDARFLTYSRTGTTEALLEQPWGPSGWDSRLSVPWPGAPSVAGEWEVHKPCGMAERKRISLSC